MLSSPVAQFFAYIIDHTVAQVCALFVSSSSPCLMRTLCDSLRHLHLHSLSFSSFPLSSCTSYCLSPSSTLMSWITATRTAAEELGPPDNKNSSTETAEERRAERRASEPCSDINDLKFSHVSEHPKRVMDTATKKSNKRAHAVCCETVKRYDGTIGQHELLKMNEEGNAKFKAMEEDTSQWSNDIWQSRHGLLHLKIPAVHPPESSKRNEPRKNRKGKERHVPLQQNPMKILARKRHWNS